MRWVLVMLVGLALSMSGNARAAGLSFLDGTASDRAVLTIADGGMQRYMFNGAGWSEKFGQVIWWHESVGQIICVEVSPTQMDPVTILCKDDFATSWYSIGSVPSWISSTHITLGGDGAQPIVDVLVNDGAGGQNWWNYDGNSWLLVLAGLPPSAQIDSQEDRACASGYINGLPGIYYWCDWTGARRTVAPVEQSIGSGNETPLQPIVSHDRLAIPWIDFPIGQGWYVFDSAGRPVPATALPGHYYQAVSDTIGGIVWHGPTGLWQWDNVADVATQLPVALNHGVWLDQNLGAVHAVLLTNPWPVVFSAPQQVWP